MNINKTMCVCVSLVFLDVKSAIILYTTEGTDIC